MAAAQPPASPWARVDDASFASATYDLRKGSNDTPQAIVLKPSDRDVMIEVHNFDKVDRVRLLHLQHVVPESVEAAKAAVDAFVAQVAADVDDKGHGKLEGTFYREGEDKAHAQVERHAEKAGRVAGVKIKWEHGSFPRKAMRTAGAQPKYSLRFDEEGRLEHVTGSRSASDW